MEVRPKVRLGFHLGAGAGDQLVEDTRNAASTDRPMFPGVRRACENHDALPVGQRPLGWQRINTLTQGGGWIAAILRDPRRARPCDVDKPSNLAKSVTVVNAG